MLLNYLTELKKGLSNKDFIKFIKDVENDIKVNRVAFGKRTSTKDFINICEMLKGVLAR
ncbi:hypothetical protein [Clostridium tertium]|jgi:hypothetical protein|uniref:Uncharacterized protein n=1 Tax=Clostridium tertium TaxID=1559 RepID=A0A9X3XKB4_9CLOT|nr:hypothetical protein [Clostridium tertium]MDC4239639.1 hypothetical protein [Clostridium tertium]